MLPISVLVPTYRRPIELERCLEALRRQTRLADEVVVVVRDTDAETWTLLERFSTDRLPLRTIPVSTAGVIAAMNAGLEIVQGEIIVFTDDDAAPHPDWLACIEAHFLSDHQIGGVGGRDWVYHGTQLEDGAQAVVGRVQWFGRVIGNHHLGVGAAREVDILKGVNMSYRSTAIQNLRFDERMRGTGAQVHFEIAFSLTVKRAGWKLIYDPLVAVDHYPAQRFDEDQRNQLNDLAMMNAVHNETLALLEYLSPLQRIVFLLWIFFVGTHSAPGFVQWLRLLVQQDKLASRKWLASVRGRWQGWQSWHSRDRSINHASNPLVNHNSKAYFSNRVLKQ